MKKIVFLFITVTLLISCEPDNDSDVDPIIGNWKLTSVFVGDRETYISNECSSKSSISYFDNGTYFNDIYHNDIYGDCTHSESKSYWINLGNSQYNLDGGKTELMFSQNNRTHKKTTEIFDTLTNEKVKLIMTYSKN